MRTPIASYAALIGLAGALLGGGAAAEEAPQSPPGLRSFWTYAGKTGVGTSYEAYTTNGQYADDGPTGAISRV
jgi:glucoamylase